MPQLQTYRNQIDDIDNQILKLLQQRFEVVKKVGVYKKENNLPALQPKRWQEVLESKKNLAQKYDINPLLIENIWNEIHSEALRLEE